MLLRKVLISTCLPSQFPYTSRSLCPFVSLSPCLLVVISIIWVGVFPVHTHKVSWRGVLRPLPHGLFRICQVAIFWRIRSFGVFSRASAETGRKKDCMALRALHGFAFPGRVASGVFWPSPRPPPPSPRLRRGYPAADPPQPAPARVRWMGACETLRRVFGPHRVFLMGVGRVEVCALPNGATFASRPRSPVETVSPAETTLRDQTKPLIGYPAPHRVSVSPWVSSGRVHHRERGDSGTVAGPGPASAREHAKPLIGSPFRGWVSGPSAGDRDPRARPSRASARAKRYANRGMRGPPRRAIIAP